MIALARGFGVDFSAVKGKTAAPQNQPLGGYCGGKHLEECRATFGEALKRTCSTCPE